MLSATPPASVMVYVGMRSRRATGWLDFRMRSMLASLAQHHLWLQWSAAVLSLARHFLDFETGIHWSPMQTESDTTGIPRLRIDPPTRQAPDQDPQGVFVRRWVPEFGTAAYPTPIVDERTVLTSGQRRGAAAPVPQRQQGRFA